MSTMTPTKQLTKQTAKLDLPPPGKFTVVIYNDNVTPIDFVIAVLTEVFRHSVEEAYRLTMLVHETGSAVVAVLPYEIAEQKAVETTILARNNNFPLDVKVKPEN